MNQKRRTLLRAASATLAAWSSAGFAATPPTSAVEVWKDPNCGCCAGWVQHLEAAGFSVKINDVGNNAIRARLGMPSKLGSCHTARVAGYVIEGHVPAADIKRLIEEKPFALGLAVPGMPIGSPGMEDGNRRDAYDVLLVLRNGNTRVFQSYARVSV